MSLLHLFHDSRKYLSIRHTFMCVNFSRVDLVKIIPIREPTTSWVPVRYYVSHVIERYTSNAKKKKIRMLCG
jgi:hypothetical protein